MLSFFIGAMVAGCKRQQFVSHALIQVFFFIVNLQKSGKHEQLLEMRVGAYREGRRQSLDSSRASSLIRK